MEYPFENKLYELDMKVVEDEENESDVFGDLDDISTTGTMASLLQASEKKPLYI
jgi:hypothetical protein